jgi:hypothetical protein
MKKITLLLSFIACVVFAQAQELITNGGFETWTDAVTPAPNWTPTLATGQTFSQEAVIVHSGMYSLKSISGSASGTAKMITKPYVVVTAGKTYTFSFWYYTDASTTNLTGGLRMWGYWENPDGSNGTFVQTNLQPATYIDQTSSIGAWQQFSVDITAPAGSGQVELDLRIYKNTTLYIDDVSLVEKLSTNLSTPIANELSLSKVGKSLLIKNVTNGTTVDIYSAIGARVQSSKLENSAIQLNELSKGLYIVRVGKLSSKIML